jgi:hypothetical protein
VYVISTAAVAQTLLSQLDHANVIKCFAVITPGSAQPPMLVMELMSLGDLRNYLIQRHVFIGANVRMRSFLATESLESLGWGFVLSATDSATLKILLAFNPPGYAKDTTRL